MIHHRLEILTVCLAGLLTGGCQDLGEGSSESGEWAIYTLSDPSLTSYQVRDTPLSALTLAPRPLISVSDVRLYHWETHAIEFASRADSLLDSLRLHWGSTQGRPFVVTVGTDRIYIGTLWWAFSSMMPPFPYIELISSRPRSIQLPPFHQGADPRSDGRLYHALKRAGVLGTDGAPVP